MGDQFKSRNTKEENNGVSPPELQRVMTVDEAVATIGMGAFQRTVLFATGTCFMVS